MPTSNLNVQLFLLYDQKNLQQNFNIVTIPYTVPKALAINRNMKKFDTVICLLPSVWYYT